MQSRTIFYLYFCIHLRTYISIGFICIFLSANTELGQVLKFPVLIHHYLEHVALNQNESFSHFLNTHYQKEINHPDDQHGDHQRLPFKTTDGHSVHVPVIIPHTDFGFPMLSELEFIDNKVYSTEEHHSQAHLTNIWQPPRFC